MRTGTTRSRSTSTARQPSTRSQSQKKRTVSSPATDATGVERIEAILREIEDDIVVGTMLPGQRLDERTLALRFGTSRTPIREVLVRLSTLGIVELRRNQGAFITEISSGRLVGMLEVLGSLKMLAARQSARCMTIQERQRLLALKETMRGCVERQDFQAYFDHATALHDAVCEGAHNAFLLETTRNIQICLCAYRRHLSRVLHLPIQTSLEENCRIVDAIVQGDAQEAERWMARQTELRREEFADLITLVSEHNPNSAPVHDQLIRPDNPPNEIASMTMPTFEIVATGLRFPEGPAVMSDGSILFVECERGTVTRLAPGGKPEVVAYVGGGPNGLAIGPDGAAYVCNNGGFIFHEEPGMLRPIGTPDSYVGGSIQRVDLRSGEVRTLYGGQHGPSLKGPNDLVFDAQGHFWFTDMGKTREHTIDRARVFYAAIDGSFCREVIHPMLGANGIALSPDEKTLYVAETVTCRLWAFDITGPGKILSRPWPSPHGGRLLHASSSYQFFDSLAVEESGNICVGTLINGGITVVSPGGERVAFIPTPDPYATNLCFGGQGGRTVWITLSTSGQLVKANWPRAGRPTRY